MSLASFSPVLALLAEPHHGGEGLPEWILELAGLLAVAVMLGVVARKVNIPLTVVLVVVGFIVSWVTEDMNVLRRLEGREFEEVLIYLFLPILIFAAALGLHTRIFFRNLLPILTLAVISLGISAAIVALAVFVGLGIPVAAALLFGVFISATDPVAVVAIFRQLGVPERLLTMVEGESMLNDGVAIVGFNILLGAALGAEFSLLGAVTDFLLVAVGGAAIGGVIGLAAALALPYLDRLAAAALSVAVAYGGSVLAQYVFGFSGVMAAVAAGLVLGAAASSRATDEVRETWEELWESLDYVANALLFLMIGLVIDVDLIAANVGPILLAVVAVLVARVLAVVPMVVVLERLGGIPHVGARNQAVIIWGGLRGGVALALALALPQDLPQRPTFIAMTAGVVLATLLLNATTISALVRRLGLDEPSRSERFLSSSARLLGVRAARERMRGMDLQDPVVASQLDIVEQEARSELEELRLTDEEETAIVMLRGLHVERETYQQLNDDGMLQPPVTRTLLNEVDDHIEKLEVGEIPAEEMADRERPEIDRAWRRILVRLRRLLGENPTELARAEASARRLGARRTGEALGLLERLPNIDSVPIERVKETFARWEEEAIASLEELEGGTAAGGRELRRRRAETLARFTCAEELEELAEAGLLPEEVARRAALSIPAARSS